MVYLRGSNERPQAVADVLSRQAATPAGPGYREAIGHKMGTTAAARVTTARLGPVKMPPDLGFKGCAPTATRTRDLLLRRQSLYPLSYRGLPRF